MQQVLTDQQALANIAANVTALIGTRSYSEVARMVSAPKATVYPATIERIAKGKHMPGAGLLARLAEHLGVTVDDLLASPAPNPARKKNLEKIAG
jgi:transcriptional regulator with XRE-family HTH domain